MNNKKFYSLAKYYDIAFGWNPQKEVDFLDWSLNKFSGRRVKKVLDLACGPGRVSLELAKRGYEVTALDSSPEMIALFNKRAKEQKLPAKAFVGDMANFKFDKKFDAIICLMGSFSYLNSKEKRINHFRSINKNLKEEGIYILDELIYKTKNRAINRTQEWIEERDNIKVKVFCNLATVNKRPDKMKQTLVLNISDHNHKFQTKEITIIDKLYLPDFKNFLSKKGFNILATFPAYNKKSQNKGVVRLSVLKKI